MADKRLDVIIHWATNPHDFVVQVFGAEPDKWQSEALEDIVLHDRISIRSGHGVGKTAFLSWAIFYWLMTRFPARVACTAPTGHQLSDILWGELFIWKSKMDPALSDLYELTTDRLYLKSNPKASVALARTARTEQPEAFQGQHSPNMLFIADEASGIDDIIFEVGSGALSTPGAKLIMTGNPTRTYGYFYDSFHKMREEFKTRRVSCFDSKMVDPNYPKRMARQYGEDSNIYAVRVLGDFPLNEDNCVIPMGWLESAVERDVDVPIDKNAIRWGLDVGRFGDDPSALAKRAGRLLLEPVREWKKKDLMQTAGIVVDEWNRTPPAMRPSVILVDVIGLGAGVVDRLKELDLPVRGVNVAESAASRDRFMRLRDELWWMAREWFQEKDSRIPRDDGLIGELCAPTYSTTSSGKILVETKEEMKKRGLPSPNKADAFNLTMAFIGARGAAWRRPIEYSAGRVI